MSLFRGLLAATVLCAAAYGTEPVQPKPVYFRLYTRIDDHVHKQSSEERIVRVLSNVAEYRKRHPEAPVKPVMQFSGAMVDVLAARNKELHLADQVRGALQDGLIELGYHGSNEPTYRNRPKVKLAKESPGDQLWTARTDVAEQFLTYAKDPLTGALDAKRSGGLKRVQEEFGPVVLVTGAFDYIGSDAPTMTVVHRFAPKFMTFGLPDPNPLFAIHGYRGSVAEFAKRIAPVSMTSPELYWSDEVLRSSDTDGASTKAFNAAEGPEALKALIAKMDRSKPRVIHIEYGDELRYLQATAEGTPRFHPLVWAYDHPDAPNVPSAVPAFTYRAQVDAAYEKEAKTLDWLASEFMPANQGSAFVTPTRLMAMAETPMGTEISQAAIRKAASDFVTRYDAYNGVFAADFAQADNHYFSLTDMFQLLAKSLAGSKGNGFPASIKLTPIYGPIHFPPDLGNVVDDITPASVIHAASLAAGPLSKDVAVKKIPINAVPTWVTVGGKKLNAAQFLRVMADVYLDPSPDRKRSVRPCEMFSAIGGVHPRNVSRTEQGSTWTLRPAMLHAAAR